MLKEEKELRKSIRAYFTNYDLTDTPYVNYAGEGELRKLITALVRAVREDEREIWDKAARNSHKFHRCNMDNPCELCLLLNPAWKPAAIRARR